VPYIHAKERNMVLQFFVIYSDVRTAIKLELSCIGYCRFYFLIIYLLGKRQEQAQIFFIYSATMKR